MKEEILQKFLGLLEGDPDLLGADHAHPWAGFTVAGGRCVFTLRALFESLSPQLERDFAQFRSELYRSSLNADLLARGYKIEVHHTTWHVDSSSYRLVKL